jgi:pyruvate dehydrogenase E2 component (dihydrolipoamide acetyltransferase)
MTEVIMPKMGDGMEEGTLVEWLKGDGDEVKSGEVIGTIQTDKATLELESPGKGKLTGFLIGPGQTVPVGVPIAAILKEGESLPSGWAAGGQKPVAEPAAASVERTPEPVVAAAVAAPTGGRIKASPLARKVAAETGIDLAGLAGTGPGGRIIERDVRAAGGARPAAAVAAPVSATVAVQGDTKVALNPLRRITAQRTVQAKTEAPHFYVSVEVDVERLMELREMFKADESGAVSVNDFVLLACARALRDVPEVNASFGGDHVLLHGRVSVGMAVAVPDGLLVAVLHDTDHMGLRQVAERSRALAKKASEGKLHPDEMQGSTFSVSNMGMLDVDNFAAIINTPNAGILAVSTARRKAVVEDDGSIVARWRMAVTGSFDHRVVDGAVGARFVNAVLGYLEKPSRLLG